MNPSSDSAVVTLLAIDDEPQYLQLIVEVLGQQGLNVVTAADPELGWAMFLEHHPKIVLLDLMMPKITGIQLLDRIMARDPGTEVILMTGQYSPESAVEAIKKGAADYLPKPLDLATLRARIEKSVADTQRRSRASQLDRKLLEEFQFESIVGRSPAMLDLFATVQRVARHFRTALITGSTGTGKELVAQVLHKLSPVASHVMAICNCSALTETLYESELFGYVRGAFTGATQDKVGLFEYANGGTVFLDEIGELPLAGQAKLLRVLQNQEIQRVGSPAVRRVDVRVIAATNRDLRAMVADKLFREDLFYRLSMVEIALPSLSDRKEDLFLLQQHFVEKFSRQYNKQILGLTRRAQLVLARYRWPGNVRELENVIGNASMMVQGDVIDIGDLPDYLRAPASADAMDDMLLSMDEVQRRHAANAVKRLGGNKAKAAEALGISRTTLYSLLRESDDSAHKT